MPLTVTSRARATLAALLGVVLAAAMLVFAPMTSASATESASSRTVSSGLSAKTLVTDGFQAGNIISDAVFFDSSTMSAAQIDSFLRGKVTKCQSGYTCLKDYTQKTPNRSADTYCNGYAGANSESAATMIAKVAQSCGINPQVLLVMLEKEQSLVTHTWPSDWRYTKAFGMACPDTAACDPAYAGLFNQLYGAARQMKIYAEGKYFTYYAPGKTWNIRYSPNAACGSSAVYIQNVATAALYYYTPYQPNAAALRAGYGTGDSCSAYGNRNFYNYFTQWFGSTQGSTASAPSSGLVVAKNSGEIYLISDGSKHYVTNLTDLALLKTRLGNVVTASDASVAAIPTGNRVIRLVRDARDGGMYLIQPDGTKHHFSSFALIRQYGFNSDDYLSLSSAQIDAFPTGAEVGNYFRSEDSGDYYLWENGKRRHIANALAWQLHQSKAGNYVAVLPAGNAAYPALGLSVLAPGTLVKEPAQNEVYIVGTGSQLVHIPSWDVSTDAGITAYSLVSKGDLSGYTKSGDLTPLFTCSDGTYVVDGGKITRVTNTALTGTGPTLVESVCAVLSRSGRVLTGAVFLKAPNDAAIYALENGTRRHMQTTQRVFDVTGGRAPDTVSMSTTAIQQLTYGAPYFRDGAFVSFGGPEIYVTSGKNTIRHVTTPAVLLRLAGSSTPVSVSDLPAAMLASYTQGAPVT